MLNFFPMLLAHIVTRVYYCLYLATTQEFFLQYNHWMKLMIKQEVIMLICHLKSINQHLYGQNLILMPLALGKL